MGPLVGVSGTQYLSPTQVGILLLLSFAAAAHTPVATRTLKLHVSDGRLEGVLTFHLPAAGAQVYALAPDPAVALVPRATAGLRIEPLQPKIKQATARRGPDGSIDATYLLDAGPSAPALTIHVEAEPPLPIDLDGPFTLESGPGAARKGGLSLRPRPGMPCKITWAGSRDTRR